MGDDKLPANINLNSGLSVQPAISDKAERFRRAAGYVVVATSACFIVALGLASLSGVGKATVTTKTADQTIETLSGALLAAHAIITIALVTFCYALLQVGERLLIPTALIRTTEDLKLLLGVKSPASKMTSEARGLLKAITPLAVALNPTDREKK